MNKTPAEHWLIKERTAHSSIIYYTDPLTHLAPVRKVIIRIVSENGNNKSLDIPSVNMPGKYLQTPSDMTATVVGLGPNNRVGITQSRDRHTSVHLIVADLDLARSFFSKR